ncbi:MAG: NAD+ kinase [Gammaproteobacteria bacterium]|jgi:NAD+ kinase
MFQTIGLVCKHDDERVPQTVRALVNLLRGLGVTVLISADSADICPELDVETVAEAQLGETCDLIIVIGGDGTFLRVARALEAPRARLLGVNLGRLGFLTDISPADMEAQLGPILSGEFDEDLRFLLDMRIRTDGRERAALRALNEIVVHKHNIARLIRFETYVDAQLVNSQRSDGLIVATPTGSTAYALSGGGPILHPNLDALVLVPICPHTLSSRPLVINSESHIEIVIRDPHHNGADLSGDGQDPITLNDGDRVIIRRKAEPLHLVHPKGHDHFSVLRAKLHWAREL